MALAAGPGSHRPSRALAEGRCGVEPDFSARLGIALEHLRDTLAFYGDALGLRIFRKHLASYVEAAALPVNALARRAAKSRLCQMTSAREVESALTALWSERAEKIAA